MAEDLEKQAVNEPKPKLLPMPDVGDLLFIGVMYILLFGRPHFLFQDASLGWHLEAGKFIWQTHSIPYTDLFSYTFADKAWVAYEWLFDLIAYLLVLLGGYNLLAVVIAGFIAMTMVRMYDGAREYGSALGLATFASIVGILASAIHWLARPHIVTFLAVSYFVSVLERFDQGKVSAKRLIVHLTLMMLLWVNCHPAFLLGIAITGIYFGINFLSTVKAWQKEGFEKRKQKTLSLFLASSIVSLATLFNPYGWNLHIYIFKYLRGSSILENTDEFLSPVFHDDIHALCLEILFLLLVVGLAISKRKLSGSYLTVILMFMHLALSAVRNIPLFAIVSVPAIGLLSSKTNLADRFKPLPESINKLTKPFVEFDAQEKLCKMRILASVYFLFITVTALLGGNLLGIINLDCGFDKKAVPTTTLQYIKTHKLPFNRGFNYDNWGGLIRYQLDMRVFIDDRADFYGEKFYTQYGKIVQTQEGFEDLLDENKIEWVLMPSNTKLAIALKSKNNWTLAASDQASSLYVRKKDSAL